MIRGYHITIRWRVTDCGEHSLTIFLCSFTALLPGFCFIFFHSSLLWDKGFFCKRIHPFVLFSLSLCSSQSLISVTLKFCNPSQTFFIKWVPVMTSLPSAPEAILQLVRCGCIKTRCSTNRCNCRKAELKCTNLCRCADSGDLCENQLDTDAEDEEEEEMEYESGDSDASDS